MCKKNVERILDFNHEIKQLYEISLEEDLRYIKSDVGINANGYIYVIGKYDDGEGIKEFEELLEVDILAPFEKIDDEEVFAISVEEYDYHVLHGDLWLEITLRIQGLLEENKKQVPNIIASKPENLDEMEEKARTDEKIKNDNMETIEEKIDEFLYRSDEDNLTADKLTSIIHKVIKNNQDLPVNASLGEETEFNEEEMNVEAERSIVENDPNLEKASELDSIINEIPLFSEELVVIAPLVEYKEETPTFNHVELDSLEANLHDHILEIDNLKVASFFDRLLRDVAEDSILDHIMEMREEEPRQFERVLQDVLEDAVIDHITDMREVVALLDEAITMFYDTVEIEKNEMEEATCSSVENMWQFEETNSVTQEIINTLSNPYFEETFNHLVLHSNRKTEYEYNHAKCMQGKNPLESSCNEVNIGELLETFVSSPSQFSFPLYKEDKELLEMPKFEGLHLINEDSDEVSLEELEKVTYSMDDFMQELDLLEEEWDSDLEVEQDIDIIDEPIEVMNKAINNLDTKVELIMENEIAEESNNKEMEVNINCLLEDILDDTKTVKSSIKYVVARQGDTYGILAKRYNVDERALAKCNNYKVIESRCIIEIPLS